jgi:hypothetical protein
MPPADGPTADVEMVASAAADELRFYSEPEVRVSFPGTGERDSRQITSRTNIDTRAAGKAIPPGRRDDADQQPPRGLTTKPCSYFALKKWRPAAVLICPRCLGVPP